MADDMYLDAASGNAASPGMDVPTLRAPRSRREWHLAADLLAAAFHEDPFNRILMPDAAARRRVFVQVYRMLLRFFRIDGTILLLSDQSEGGGAATHAGSALPGKAGGAVPAGVIVFRAEGERRSAGKRLARLLRLAAAFAQALALPVRMLFMGVAGELLRRSRSLRASYGTLREAYKPFEDRPYLSLELVAVRSDLRGNGLMGRMLRPLFEEADRRGLAIVLNTETPENLPIYAHYGFETAAAVEVVPDVLTYHVLFRKPARIQ